ncbi:hypothetical protein BH11MYX3_BH11MYX3_31000 [soil metagenome]
MSADPKALVGRVLASRYRLEAHLGRGAMGDVYRARHVKVPRMFAVKVLLPELVKDPKVVARFEREAELAGRLRHRNVTSVIDVGETDGTRYLVMDFAEGCDLGELMARQPMHPTRAMALVAQIVDGLEHAHTNQMVHRDLKPENIIVEEGEVETARIVDFGVAILRDGAATAEGRLTTGGLVIGTPHYMAPELATGKAFDHRVDLFALGVILYEMLTGVMPYEGTGVEVAMANIAMPTPPMSVRAPGVMVDPLLEALTRYLMEKKVDHRPQSAKEVRALIELIATERGTAAALLGVSIPRTSLPSQPPPLAVAAASTPATPELSTRELLSLASRRTRKIAWTAFAALLLVLLGGGIALIGANQASTHVAIELDTEIHPTPVSDRGNAREMVPAMPPITDVVAVTAPIDGPHPIVHAPAVTAELARKAPVEVSPADARSVVAMYTSLARELKQISDRRDMAADDLWQRYRRIRIQDALRSSVKRAEAMNELAMIDREIGKRFRN